MKFGFIVMCVLFLYMIPVLAQDAIEPTVVELEVTDDVILVGDYYAQPEAGAVTVLLLHMYDSRRNAWSPLIPSLLEAGYNILNVDLRGHGDSGGRRDMLAAVTDVQAWIDWIGEQSESSAVALVGGSIGSNLALVGCANDERCLTAIALSPGLNYYDVEPAESVAGGLADRSALLVGAYRDGSVVPDILSMVAEAEGEIGIRFYTGGSHGTSFFRTAGEPFMHMLLAWLNEHTTIEE